MTSRHIWSLLRACCSADPADPAESASLGGSMATLLPIYGAQNYLSSPYRADARAPRTERADVRAPRTERADAPWQRPHWRRPDVTRLVVINSVRVHLAGRLLSSPSPIAEMSSTVRRAVTANRPSRACS